MRAAVAERSDTPAIPATLVAAAKAAPYLSAGEERDLAIRWRDHGDKLAGDRLIRAHLRLGIRMASKYFGYGLPIEDLVSEASIGLTRALKNFDPDKGFRFSTYAIWWIRAALSEYVIYNSSVVKSGTTHDERRLFYRLRHMKARLGAYANDEISSDVIQMIAANLRTDPNTVIALNALMSGDVSLNAAVATQDAYAPELIDLIEDEGDQQEILVDRTRAQVQNRAIVQHGLKSLSDRERDILERRHLTEYPVTLRDLGIKYGVSMERIRQIEAKAFKVFRARVRERIPKFCD